MPLSEKSSRNRDFVWKKPDFPPVFSGPDGASFLLRQAADMPGGQDRRPR